MHIMNHHGIINSIHVTTSKSLAKTHHIELNYWVYINETMLQESDFTHIENNILKSPVLNSTKCSYKCL